MIRGGPALRPTYRNGNQCFINASVTALFAVPSVREVLQHTYSASMADDGADERAAFETFENLSKSMSDCRDTDVLEGNSELRLAVTFMRAREGSDYSRAYPPWLMWNRFYNWATDAQEDAHECRRE